MKSYIKNTLLLVSLLFPIVAFAQNKEEDMKYRRSSLYSVLVSHNEQKFHKEIRGVFESIPIPDKYNNHDLSVKVLNVDSKDKYDDAINDFINNSNVASRMVAKWFNRDKFTGVCDMELIKERGIYSASELDKELAARSARGEAMLADAGEELIGQSFVLVNEINYIDKSKRANNTASIIKIVGILGSMIAPGISTITDNIGDMIARIQGFSVRIHTRLYQLEWNDEMAGTFYSTCYTSVPDDAKRDAFEANRPLFKLKYIGDVESSGGTTSFAGINRTEPELMIRKACERAIDDNIADLQKKYEQFRVKCPILDIDEKGNVSVAIGKKEAIDENSKYEVLEMNDKNGKTTYKRVAVIVPVKNKIWDNRFMALEEGAFGADFGYTTFKKSSGGEILPGMLVREIN